MGFARACSRSRCTCAQARERLPVCVSVSEFLHAPRDMQLGSVTLCSGWFRLRSLAAKFLCRAHSPSAGPVGPCPRPLHGEQQQRRGRLPGPLTGLCRVWRQSRGPRRPHTGRAPLLLLG